MGYLLAGLGLAVLFVLMGVLLSKNTTKPGRPQLKGDHPPLRTEPSADEPTPARSVTATPNQANAAQSRTPPS